MRKRSIGINVRVTVTDLPWDQGTRRERDPTTGAVLQDWELLANLLEEIDGDGINARPRASRPERRPSRHT